MAKKFSIKKFAAGVLALLMVVTALPVSGVTATTAKAADDAAETLAVYRSYNPNSGEHFMTTDETEHKSVVAAGRNDEGIAWYAPEESGTPVYRSYNPNTGEHLLVPQEEAEWLETQGWNNEGIKIYSDDAKGVAIFRVYNPNARDAGGHLYTSREEAAYLVSQGWRWDNQGQPVIYGVKDESVLVELIDNDGLQSDGTALVNDKLQATYSAGLGNPSQIVWYKDGKALSSTVGSLQFVLDTDPGTTTGAGVGVYTAVITNSSGKSFISNAIEVVQSEELAEIWDYTLTQDYENGVTSTNGTAKIDYAAETDHLVATFTVNKAQYAGTFGVLETSKVTSGKAKASDIIATAASNTFDVITKASDFTDAKAIDTCAYDGNKNGIYIENNDGSKTYKWVVCWKTAKATLTRGTEYFLGMSQTNVSTATDITTYAFGGSAEAPYLDAPDSVEISQCSLGLPIKVDFKDSEGNVIDWLGGKSGSADAIGLDSAIIYANTSNGKTGATKLDTATKNVLKGTLTSAQNANSTYSYYWAEMTWPEGIFGEDELTLTSDIQKIASKSVDQINVYEDPDVHTTAVIKFTNLATSGTIYLVNSDTYANAAKALKDGDASAIVGSDTVSRGDSEVKMENALRSAEKTTNDAYFAIFVPDDQKEYSMAATTTVTNKSDTEIPEAAPTAASQGLTVTQIETKYALSIAIKDQACDNTNKTFENNAGDISTSANEGTINLVKIYDQFGEEFAASSGKYTGTVSTTTWKLTQVGNKDGGTTGVSVQLGQNGTGSNEFTTLKLTTTTAGSASTKWTGTTDQGQVITATSDGTGKTWTVTIE